MTKSHSHHSDTDSCCESDYSHKKHSHRSHKSSKKDKHKYKCCPAPKPDPCYKPKRYEDCCESEKSHKPYKPKPKPPTHDSCSYVSEYNDVDVWCEPKPSKCSHEVQVWCTPKPVYQSTCQPLCTPPVACNPAVWCPPKRLCPPKRCEPITYCPPKITECPPAPKNSCYPTVVQYPAKASSKIVTKKDCTVIMRCMPKPMKVYFDPCPPKCPEPKPEPCPKPTPHTKPSTKPHPKPPTKPHPPCGPTESALNYYFNSGDVIGGSSGACEQFYIGNCCVSDEFESTAVVASKPGTIQSLTFSICETDDPTCTSTDADYVVAQVFVKRYNKKTKKYVSPIVHTPVLVQLDHGQQCATVKGCDFHINSCDLVGVAVKAVGTDLCFYAKATLCVQPGEEVETESCDVSTVDSCSVSSADSHSESSVDTINSCDFH